jgi:SAM-dependent methyltransferase
LQCLGCAGKFSLRNETAVFLSGEIEIAPPDHESNPLGPEFEAILQRGEEFILHLGAGATVTKYPNCVEMEHRIFRHTDVVGDAHALPFRADVFDRVFAFNVFEHLREPKRAAAEIWRVLKPGGRVIIHTAFLQPLHEAPFHFYNATEFGVREWFDAFAIEHCGVSGNFSPAYAIAFLMSNVMEAARRGGASVPALAQLAGTSLGEWAVFWERGTDPPPGFELLQGLPQHLQKRIAAGFELRARKPNNSRPELA